MTRSHGHVPATCAEQGWKAAPFQGTALAPRYSTPTHTPTPRWPPNVPSNINYFRILVIKPQRPNLCLPLRSAISQRREKKERRKKRIPPETELIIIKYSRSYSKSPKPSEFRP